MDALTLHRIHFAFTITYHYLFPQLTMGLALLIVVLKTLALRTVDPEASANYDKSSRFWAKIFAINFLLGVVTGIPMEFQFGTNWSEFSRRTGGVIGMPLAMEGIFSFFLESAFLGLFLFGEKRLSRTMHWLSRRPRLHRLLDLRLLHHRHQRLDAAPRRLHPPPQWRLRSRQLPPTSYSTPGRGLSTHTTCAPPSSPDPSSWPPSAHYLPLAEPRRPLRPHLPQARRRRRRSSPASSRSSRPATSTASTWPSISPPPSPPWKASSTPKRAPA